MHFVNYRLLPVRSIATIRCRDKNDKYNNNVKILFTDCISITAAVVFGNSCCDTLQLSPALYRHNNWLPQRECVRNKHAQLLKITCK